MLTLISQVFDAIMLCRFGDLTSLFLLHCPIQGGERRWGVAGQWIVASELGEGKQKNSGDKEDRADGGWAWPFGSCYCEVWCGDRTTQQVSY